MLNFRVRPLALLLCTLFTLPAGAGPSDALHLYAGVGYGHDDNLLRVPEGQPAFDGTRADSWWEREGGLIFDKTYSRQRISIVAKLSKYDFDHFKQLNYDGKDLQATWFWQLGNHLEGKVGTTYQQVLAPYTTDMSELWLRGASFVSQGPRPGVRYARLGVTPGINTVTGGVLSSGKSLPQDNYPAPGQAQFDRAQGLLPVGIPGLSN